MVVVTVLWAGFFAYRWLVQHSLGLVTIVVSAIAIACLIGALRYIKKGGVWSLLITKDRIAWQDPDYGDRTLKVSDIDHFQLRRIPGTVEGGDRREVWLTLVNGEPLQVPPNCIVDEPKVWNALATVVRRTEV